ncbi:TetR/AcrR family transcriptional regulator [Nonomuraea sp. NPDC049709]|uniref:TetR/AcrR family transcriptional regulator n=1 Tax=Nonomuraea sp. NPDC049709 TaxID=3154736 RepID=UPI00342D818A
MPKPPDMQRRSERSRLAILSSALELCAEHGYGKVTVEAIAARAGASKKTIYRWWPSKGAVVLEAITTSAQAGTPFPDTGDIAADLRVQITGVIEVLTSPQIGSAYTGLIAEAQHDGKLMDAMLDQLIRPRVDLVIGRLRQAQERGELRDDADPQLITELLYGPIYYRMLLHLGLQSADRIQSLIDYVIGPLMLRRDG